VHPSRFRSGAILEAAEAARIVAAVPADHE
jgi:hypothetical protein